MQERPRNDEALQRLGDYEQMVNTFAEQEDGLEDVGTTGRTNGPWHRSLGGDATRVHPVA